MTQRRQDREREFHDAYFGAQEDARGDADRFYEVTQASSEFYREAVLARSRGNCLEYGSAGGEHTIELAKHARSAIGFDISGVVVDQARKRAANVSSAARFEVAEAESLPFEDSSFDLAFGSSVLHHLELAPSVQEMVRVLRPSGSGTFLEPLGHNPLINWYRNRTPGMRTPDEHPLVRSDFALFRRSFAEVDIQFFHLGVLASAFLVGKPGFNLSRRVLGTLDNYLLGAIPGLRYQAWVCVMRLQGPKKAPRNP